MQTFLSFPLLACFHFRLVICEDRVPFRACVFRTSTSSLALAINAVSRSPESIQADDAAAHDRPRLLLYEYCIPALIVSALVGVSLRVLQEHLSHFRCSTAAPAIRTMIAKLCIPILQTEGRVYRIWDPIASHEVSV